MTLPLLHLTGNPFDQGVQHGRALREAIRHNLALYDERFRLECGLEMREVVRRARLYAEAVARHSPACADGVNGVAAGSDMDPDLIWALNVRYEIVYYEFSRSGLVDGCTAVAVSAERSADRHVWMAQNWDWYPHIRGALFHTREPDGLETLTFTEAGIVGGKIGLNSAGVGLLINGLNSSHDDWTRLAKPFHMHCHELIRQHTFEAAVATLTDSTHGCSANFVVGHADGRMVNVEMSPVGYLLPAPRAGCLIHTNHFLNPAAGGIDVPENERIFTIQRYNRALEMVTADDEPIGRSRLAAILSDHTDYPHSICQHPDPAVPSWETYTTVAGFMLDLTTRTMHVADGPPCTHPWRTLSLGEAAPAFPPL
jgi:isopenicillin-N N-acyltransferase-like protein